VDVIAIALARSEFVLLGLVMLAGVALGWRLCAWHHSRARSDAQVPTIDELHPWGRR
jgi:hypothetical protein